MYLGCLAFSVLTAFATATSALGSGHGFGTAFLLYTFSGLACFVTLLVFVRLWSRAEGQYPADAGMVRSATAVMAAHWTPRGVVAHRTAGVSAARRPKL